MFNFVGKVTAIPVHSSRAVMLRVLELVRRQNQKAAHNEVINRVALRSVHPNQ